MRSPLAPERDLERFFELRDIPVFCNVTYDDATTARSAATGDLELGVCPATGFVFNEAFDRTRLAYSPDYEASLHFSPKFTAWASEMTRQLAPGLEGEPVVEIGCGKGEFLRELAENARCRAIGYDTSLPDHSTTELESGGSLELRNEFLDYRTSELAPRLLLNRHVLEHVEDPIGMLREFGALLSRHPQGRLYLEVPNALWTLEQLGVWDLIYEHCGYFAPIALRSALTSAGFEVEWMRAEFGQQFLSAFARPTDSPAQGSAQTDEVAHVLELARSFRTRFGELEKDANTRLDSALKAGHTVLWGAGSKGVMLLNILERGREVAAAVDKNPRKTGRHIAGTGHRICAPQELREIDPKVVLVANPLYTAEIAEECAALGLDARVENI